MVFVWFRFGFMNAKKFALGFLDLAVKAVFVIIVVVLVIVNVIKNQEKKKKKII